MAVVNISAAVSDECGNTSWKIVGVRSSESLNGRRYGNSSEDFKIIGDHTVELRAERSGNSDARTYYVTVQAIDAAGNQSDMQTVTVTVPKSQGKAKL